MNRDIREWGDEYITTLLRERDEAVAALKALYDAVDEVDPDHAYTFDEMAQAKAILHMHFGCALDIPNMPGLKREAFDFKLTSEPLPEGVKVFTWEQP
jgi:hypothetical protein